MSCTRSQSPLARVDGSALGGTPFCWKPGATYAPAELRSATDVTLLYFRMRLYSMNLPRAADAGRLAVSNPRKTCTKAGGHVLVHRHSFAAPPCQIAALKACTQ